LSAPEEVILDVNRLAEGQKFMRLDAMEVSDDGNLLAYTTDSVGFRQYRLHIKDLRTGKVLADTAQRVDGVAWAADNKTLFYVTEDATTKRWDLLHRHVLGQHSSADVLVYREKDERYDIEVSRTRDKKYLMMTAESHVTTEERFVAADKPTAAWTVIEPRKEGVLYSTDSGGGLFYIRVNDTAKTFRLVTAPVEMPGKARWKEIVASRPDVPLEEHDVFKDFYVLTERVNGEPVLRMVPLSGGEGQVVPMREPAYYAGMNPNPEFDTTEFQYRYESLVTPVSVFRYDVKTKESTLLKEREVPGYDRTKYAEERVFATAEDGTKVAISVVYRKDLFVKGKNAMLQTAYGSYGFALPDTFSATRLALLDRGVVIALAHIRGGGEMGEPWHDDGKMMKKRNTFTDFIACTEYLTANGYGAKDRVGIEGGSAGGLLMGAVTNMRPDLYRVVLAEVPFVDVMNTMLDASLPLTVSEYEEWGNPNEPAAFKYMLSYSPYDNVSAKKYPAMLVETSFDDSQVMYWEPAKYVAKLRALKTDKEPLVFMINMHGGHGGSSGRYDAIRENAKYYSFLLSELEATK
jgi:oligopeptidase B